MKGRNSHFHCKMGLCQILRRQVPISHSELRDLVWLIRNLHRHLRHHPEGDRGFGLYRLEPPPKVIQMEL